VEYNARFGDPETQVLMMRLGGQALDAMLDVYDTLRSPLPWSTASLTAAAFAFYRRGGGPKQKPLPDFFIGAHAAVSNLSMLTRDPTPYKNYFSRLKLVTP
jgi:predicted nucleic acid-binding protein